MFSDGCDKVGVLFVHYPIDCSIIKRMISLISHEAQLMATAEAAMKQAKSASDAAGKAMVGIVGGHSA